MDKLKVKLISIGLFAGFINGLFGSGGGAIIVPSLIFLIDLPDHIAHATAISIILPLSIISTIVYLFKNSIPLNLSTLVIIGGVFGSYLGAKFLNKIPVNILRKVFGSIIIYSALRMIIG